jgi:hypothetical protein
VLAAGAREAVGKLEKDLDEALIWDYFGRTYGWTKKTVEEDLPHALPELLLMIGEIRAENEQEERERNSSKD